jgi:hypothetical protein
MARGAEVAPTGQWEDTRAEKSSGKRLSKYGPGGIITTPPKLPYSLLPH